MRQIRTHIRTEGIAVGTAFVFVRAAQKAPVAEAQTPEVETGRFHKALGAAKAELEKLATENEIFAAHLEMADDPMLSQSVEEKIAAGSVAAETALDEACAEVCDMLGALDDEYLRARADDVRDVCARIRRCLTGAAEVNPFEALGPGTIVVADELTPSDTALMDFSRITGFVTARGSVTSHVCIIARNKGVAALVGIGEALQEIKTGDRLIINGKEGVAIIDPDPASEAEFAQRAQAEHTAREKAQEYAHRPATTPGGGRILVLANAGSVEEVREAMAAGADGIGLFRSEFLYMQSRDAFPDEQTQYEAYRAATEACGDKPIIVRTLDIGGDKSLPYMHFDPEENPFLGWRAVRISLSMQDMFKTQLRALLRASVCGNLKIMFPMITSVGEFRAARFVADECMRELETEGREYDSATQFGVMIETPAAVMVADLLAAEAQFFSIGTNDLTQYVMAADRGNSRVAYLYDPFDEAVLRSIRRVLEAARAAGIEAGMCGEFAAEERATQLLLGMGLEEFSVGAGSVAPLKARICRGE